MSYTQFGYTAFPPTSQLMVGTTASSGASGSPCCDSGGRGSSATMTPDSQSTVCSLPATYDSRLLSTYPRLATSGLYGSAAYADQAYPNFAGVDSSAFYPSLGSAYGMKDASDPWRGIGPSASYYYDPSLAAYGYGGLDFNGARRKNVTRDSTSTLKAWLNEHRKNPYPTKGEKIMLAIITKMTLTQVSTWFANARRRLKKENKMTWEPRNKMDADDVKEYEDDDLDDDDEKDDKKDVRGSGIDHRLGERDDSSSRRTGTDDSRTLSVIKRGSVGCDVDSGDDCEAPDTRMTPGGSSNDDGVDYGSSRSGPDSYHHLRHPNMMSDGLSITLAGCDVRDRHVDRHPPESSLLAPDFTPSDSSSPTLPEIQTLMRTSDEAPNKEPSLPATSRTQSNSRNCISNRTSASSSSSDLADSSGHQVKPKIWSLADTATSKSPAPSSTSQCGEVNSPGSVTDMLGHCGWFSVNPYQVTPPTSTLGGLVGSHGYPPSFASPSSNGTMFSGSASAAAAAAAAYGHGFSPVPPQTDTPPQTPPNLKVSTALPLSATSASYLTSQTAHLYFGQAAASVGKNGGIYPISHLNSGSRPYRSEILPEDFSSTSAQFRSPPIQ